MTNNDTPDTLESLLEELELLELGTQLAGEPIATKYEKSPEAEHGVAGDSILMMPTEGSALFEVTPQLDVFAASQPVATENIQHEASVDEPHPIEESLANTGIDHLVGSQTHDSETGFEETRLLETAKVALQSGSTEDQQQVKPVESAQRRKRISCRVVGILVLAVIAGAGILYGYSDDWGENSQPESAKPLIRKNVAALKPVQRNLSSAATLPHAPAPLAAPTSSAAPVTLPAPYPKSIGTQVNDLQEEKASLALKKVPVPPRKRKKTQSSTREPQIVPAHNHTSPKEAPKTNLSNVAASDQHEDDVKEIQILPPNQIQKKAGLL